MVKAGRRGAPLCVLILIVALSGCSLFAPQPIPTPTPTPTSAPTVLEMAHADGDASLDPVATWFAEEVAHASNGRLLIRRHNSCCGGAQQLMERKLVSSVSEGTFQLGWVGTRVFETLGDDDLQPLTLPMLVSTYSTQRAVASDPIAADMLAGVTRFGVVGMSIMPGYLRKPLVAREPLVDAEDWRNKTVWVFPGGSSATSVRALGATPIEGLDAGERDDDLLQHRVDATELSLTYATEDHSPIGFVSANVNLWPRTAALLANPAVYRALSHQQQAWLRTAVTATIARTGELGRSDRRAAVVLCKRGVELDWATPVQVKALAAELQPVIDAATASANEARVIRRIQDLARPDPSSWQPQPCL